MSFRGSFEHSLDDRGRVAIPAKYRAAFPNGLAVIIPAAEGCLRVFPEAEFQTMSEETASVPATTRDGRRARRLFDARSFDAELDRQGRILVPPRLRELAGLNGSVVVAGNRECLELWNPERWERELADAEASSPEGQRLEE